MTVTFLTWIGVTKRDSGASARQDSLLTNGSLVERLGQFVDLEDAPGPELPTCECSAPTMPLLSFRPNAGTIEVRNPTRESSCQLK